MSKYNDPLYIDWHRNVEGKEYSVKIQDEIKKITNNIVFLNQIPDVQYRVKIDGMFETNGEVTDSTLFKVNYENGMITFHESLNEATKVIKEYYGRGVIMYPASRIYSERDGNGNISETLQDIVDMNRIIYQNPVTTFDSIFITYPNPSIGWAVQTLSDNKIYRWNGTEWKYIQQLNIQGVQNNIDNLAGAGRTTETVKDNADKIGISLGLRISVGSTQPTDTVFWLDTTP